jgi:hypothetical protein
MKHILIFTTLLIFISKIYGQHTFGIKLNGGISNISVKTNNGQTLKHISYPQPSYNGGIYYAVNLNKKLTFGTEVLFTQINGKEYLGIPFTDNNNNPTGQYYSDTIWRHLSYLGLPIYIGYNYKKLNLNIGVQTNIRIGGKVREIGSAPLNGDTLTWDNKFTNLNGYDKLDFGIRAGFILKIYRNIGLEGNYYLGLNNNLKGSITSNWKMKNRQLTIGIRYTCFTMNRKEKKKN